MPCLLLRGSALVKTIQFRNPSYVGDPVNAIRIFNEKEVDELIFLDITATVENKPPPFDIIAEIADECFMPVTYGGGIRTVEDIKQIFGLGIEKVAINTRAVEDPLFIRVAADSFGSQSIVVSIDVRKGSGDYEVCTRGGQKATGQDPVSFVSTVEAMGAGEILLNSIDRDGTMQGYDIDLIKRVAEATVLPVIACGGAGKVDHLGEAVHRGGASAAAAGSMVVYHGKNRAVLISFPSRTDLLRVLHQQ